MPVSASPSRIRLLDPVTIDQIAAGEVVERPASALKELLENALDAGAKRIVARVKESGQALIEVEDDGCGMNSAEIAQCVLRHATSKISDFDDLSRTVTLGFRGEALPSIASVSKTTIHSADADGIGHRVVVEGGQVGEVHSETRAIGTTISVEDLFYNTPARSKFLKSDATELSQCVEAFSKAALSHPHVSFELWNNGSRLMRTSGSGDLAETLGEIWGWDLTRHLQPVSLETQAGKVTGLVSPPHVTKSVRSHQWFFVNGRPVRSRMLLAALDQAYRSLTPERRYPLTAILIEIDPGEVDVNVSPTKSEVKFRAEGAVFDLVRRSIKQSLLEGGMMPTASELARVSDALGQLSSAGSRPAEGVQTLGWPAGLFSAAAHRSRASEPASADDGLPADQSSHANGGVDDGKDRQRTLLLDVRVVGQIESTYILAETSDALLIVDQHVAHERILYERLKTTRDAAPVSSQRLLEPQSIPLDRRSLEAARPHLADLRAIGFEIEEFGDDALLLRGTPSVLTPAKASRMLSDVLEAIADNGALTSEVSARDEILILCSCKMAVKAGDQLAVPEMEKLITDLAETENPFLCPHGRPITLVIPKNDIARRFKRSG